MRLQIGEESHGLFNNCKCVYFVFYLMRLFNEGVQTIEVAILGKWTGQMCCRKCVFCYTIRSLPLILFGLSFPSDTSLTTKCRPVPLILCVSLERAAPEGKECQHTDICACLCKCTWTYKNLFVQKRQTLLIHVSGFLQSVCIIGYGI